MSLPPVGDLESTWAFIEPNLYKILGTEDVREGIRAEEFMDTYTAIYNFCVSRSRNSTVVNSTVGGDSGTRLVVLVGGEIYLKLEKFLVKYVTGLAKQADESFLEFYVRKWRRFQIGSGYLNNVFDYMNRYWVLKERSDGRRDIYDVSTLASLTWRDHLFQKNQELLVSEILEVVRLQRTNQPADPALLSYSIQSFVELGIDMQDLKRRHYGIYIDDFETPYLEATKEFYMRESNEYLKEHNVIDYIHRADIRIGEEVAQANGYLDERSRPLLLDAMHESMIQDHAGVMYEEFDKMLAKDEVKNINLMFRLLKKVPVLILLPIARLFENFIKQEGLKEIENLKSRQKTLEEYIDVDGAGKKSKNMLFSTGIDPKSYIKTLIAIHDKYAEIVKQAFENDVLLVKSLDNACRFVINSNSIASPQGYTGTSKTPEYLAKYGDLLMKKKSEEANEMSVDDIMKIFKFIDDKDAFETHYRKLLAKRLIYGTSASLETEENLITKLQVENSAQYTSRMAKMFQDMKASNELKHSFEEYAKSQPDSKDILDDFSIYVLAETMWPFSSFKHDFAIPKELVPTYEMLEKLYNEKHSGRQLKWIWNLCRGEIKANISKPGKPPFLLTMTTIQMAIVLPYNDRDSYTFAEICEHTQLPEEQVKGNIGPLVKFRLLQQSTAEIVPSTVFTVVKEYRSKRIKVNFASNIRIEQRADLVDSTKELYKDRSLFLSACIVRIMKSKRELSHVMLVNDVIQQSHTRFKASMADIKKAIEEMLEQGYISRVGRNMYQYIA